MEIDKLKHSWQRQSVDGQMVSVAAAAHGSQRLLRVATIGQRERSDAIGRLVFCVLFCTVVGLGAFLLLGSGTTRIGALLFAAAVMIDGVGSGLLLRGPSAAHVGGSILQYVKNERARLERRMRFERIANGLMLCIALLGAVLIFALPGAADSRERAYDTLAGTAILTGFLAFMWWRVRSRPREIRNELDNHLHDLASEE